MNMNPSSYSLSLRATKWTGLSLIWIFNSSFITCNHRIAVVVIVIVIIIVAELKIESEL